MKAPPLIPTVLVTNQENPIGFCAGALGISHRQLCDLIVSGVVTSRHTGRSHTLRISDAGKVAVRQAQLAMTTIKAAAGVHAIEDRIEYEEEYECERCGQLACACGVR